MHYMELQSHGPGSCLFEHLAEVMQAAQNSTERIACACHDLAKATRPWQAYNRGEQTTSPHSHSLCGALLAVSLIHSLGMTDANAQAAIAFHAVTAHHGILYAVQAGNLEEDIYKVHQDGQARTFFLEAIPRLLPEIIHIDCQAIWNSLANFINDEDCWADWKDALLAFKDNERVRVFFASRSLLGRLCAYDQASAEKQSSSLKALPLVQHFTKTRTFSPRPPRSYSARKTDPLQNVRKNLGMATVRLADSDQSPIYLICAPTGTGKTEAMLRLAENLLQRHKNRRIVYAVPQISLCDQIFSDYMQQADAQIWNHLRREHGYLPSNEEDNHNFESRIETATTPFGASYNVTTFNQVLFAVLHPHRFQCVKMHELAHSVIILDEFHKLPLTIQPFVFRLLEQFANSMHCRFILGSATPIHIPALQHPPVVLPERTTRSIYNMPKLLNRRTYHFVGLLELDQIFERINECRRKKPKQNHLIVLNLINKATLPLRQMLNISIDPWEQLKKFEEHSDNRILVLDGLVPPALRHEYITACRQAMKNGGGVTLISTQMIEVGVDLDFDTGLIDFQGLAATLQRAGRVGREASGISRDVVVFCLDLGNGNNSYAVLLDVIRKHDIRRHSPAFSPMIHALQTVFALEMDCFRQWSGDKAPKKETKILEAWLDIQQKVNLEDAQSSMANLFRTEGACSASMGYHFEDAQLLAEIYGVESDAQRAVLLWPDQRTWHKACGLLERASQTPTERSAAARCIADWSVNITMGSPVLELYPEIFVEQPPLLGRRCFVKNAENII